MARGIDRMADVRPSEPVLVGVSPGVIAIFMTLLTLIVPLGFFTSNIIVLFDWYIGPGVYALFWAFGHTPWSWGAIPFHFFSLSFLKLAFTLGIFNIIYVVQIVRYYQGKVSKRNVIITGLISLIFPTLFAFISTAISLGPALIGFVLPIPAQFLAGLIFVQMLPGPESEQAPIE
jgi:hypothetical protein